MNGVGGLLCVGHVLVDLFVDLLPEHQFMGRDLGPLHVDRAELDEVLSRFRRLSSEGKASIERRVGGGQALLALAALSLGLEASLLACVGKDEEGEFLRSSLGAAGLEAGLFEGKARTGLFVCAGSGGRRRVFVDPGAAREVRGAVIPAGWLRRGWILCLDGLLIDAPAWLGSLAGTARAASMQIALDLSTVSNVERNGRELADFAARHCDIVFANEAEFEELRLGAKERASAHTTWVVKLGPRGARSFRGDESWSAPLGGRASDFDTGAGDFFAAGYLAGKLAGRDESRCLELGNRAASLILDSAGRGLPLAELREMLGGR